MDPKKNTELYSKVHDPSTARKGCKAPIFFYWTPIYLRNCIYHWAKKIPFLSPISELAKTILEMLFPLNSIGVQGQQWSFTHKGEQKTLHLQELYNEGNYPGKLWDSVRRSLMMVLINDPSCIHTAWYSM